MLYGVTNHNGCAINQSIMILLLLKSALNSELAKKKRKMMAVDTALIYYD